MNWSPPRNAVVALLAVVALAAGAGALSGADLGGGTGVPDVNDGCPDARNCSGGSGGGGGDPIATRGGGPAVEVGSFTLTARSLVSLVAVPLSPPALAAAAVLAGVVAVAVGRRATTGTTAVDTADDADLPAANRDSGGSEVQPATGVAVDNAVYRAWERLAERVGGGSTLTPGERARRATEDGFDDRAVTRLRTLFEQVRYGGRSVTDDLQAQADETARALGLDDEAEQGDPGCPQDGDRP